MQDDVYTFSIGGYVSKTVHAFGKVVSNQKGDSGSVDFKLDSSGKEGLKISHILKFLKGIPLVDDIAMRSVAVTIHLQKGKTQSGNINGQTLLWGVPVNFMCSFEGEKLSISVMTDSSFEGGFSLAEQWTVFKKIPVRKIFSLSFFSPILLYLYPLFFFSLHLVDRNHVFVSFLHLLGSSFRFASCNVRVSVQYQNV